MMVPAIWSAEPGSACVRALPVRNREMDKPNVRMKPAAEREILGFIIVIVWS